ncbi:calpain small subunit 1-like [Malaclemys terrapin pileata]|uniref:calpain small subunit 1-like n=1 Tax=Malaclemys terrapin pileata TaxID=2991368 RepID=UPI0023A81AAC|nr:calpain small subunit 1-like [Malaclemys terrapin pileata]
MPSSMLAGETPSTALQSHTTGKLGFEEFKYLWGNVKKWQCVYKQYDTDRSGTIGSSELPGAFEAAGFRLNEQLYQMIVRRYSDENGHMDFDNFISCLVRLDAMFRVREGVRASLLAYFDMFPLHWYPCKITPSVIYARAKR